MTGQRRAAVAAAVLALSAAGTARSQSPLVVADAGVGGLTATTAFTQEAISAALDGLRVAKAMTRFEDTPIPVYQAWRGERLVVQIGAGQAGRIGTVTAFDATAAAETGAKVGMDWADTYKNAAAPRCEAGLEQSSGKVFCAAPGLSQVSLAFGGKWKGPDGTAPPADVLADWTVQFIVWRAR